MIAAGAVLAASMMAATVFQTSIAQRQLELDRIDRDISASREAYDQLRRERAELRSPGRLAEVAASAGLIPADDASFVLVPSDVLVAVRQSTGTLDPSLVSGPDELLGEFREVKAITEGRP
jgi:hypothetical protein